MKNEELKKGKKMKKLFIILTCFIYFCSYITAQEFPILKGSYLGQKFPGKTCVPFVPDIFSQDNKYSLHSTIIFSPDGKELYFTRTVNKKHTIFVMKMNPVDSAWSQPQPTPFDSQYDQDRLAFDYITGNAFFHSGNDTLLDIWKVSRNKEKWDKPVRMPSPVNTTFKETSPVLTKDGVLYFGSDREGSKGKGDIYEAIKVNGKYQSVENIGFPVNTEFYESPMLVSPDGKWLIIYSYDRLENHYFFITFKDKNGGWTPPVSMGEDINNDMPFAASLSPDGRYLFILKRLKGVYWIDAKIIDDFK